MKQILTFSLFLLASTSLATVVQPIGSASQVLIPAAGSTSGANGTFFRSDISIINLTNHDQIVSLQWLPQGGSGGTTTTTVITIPAAAGIRSSDFVASILHQAGLGSIIVTGSTSAGGPVDPTARLYVSARIWTPEPGSNGAVSQSFPAIPLSSVNTPIAALFALGGADNPFNYRVNVGVVNVDPTQAQTFQVQLLTSGRDPVVQTFTVPPMSMQQVGFGSSIAATSQIQIQNVTEAGSRSNLWTAYSSSIDNTTGDAWSEIAVAGTTP